MLCKFDHLQNLRKLTFFSLKKPSVALGKLLIRFDMQPLVYPIVLRTLSLVNVCLTLLNKEKQSNTRVLELNSNYSLKSTWWNITLVISVEFVNRPQFRW